MKRVSNRVKYFFLTDGWVIGRVWEFGGLWDQGAWRREPEILQTNICIWENDEKLWLYRVEESVLMVEVKPNPQNPVDPASNAIGQVILKRLIIADQAIDILCNASKVSDTNP